MKPKRTKSKSPVLAGFLTVEEMSDKVGRNRITIWRWRREGLIPYIKVGSKVLFSEAAVSAALEKLTVNASKTPSP